MTPRRGAQLRRGLLLSGLLLALPARGQLTVEDVEYDCKVVASNVEEPLLDGSLDRAPALDQRGRVAFLWTPGSDSDFFPQIRTGVGDTDENGVPVTELVAGGSAESGGFASLGPPAIDATRGVVWQATRLEDFVFQSGVFRRIDPAVEIETLLLDRASDPSSPFSSFQDELRVASDGTLLFRAQPLSGSLGLYRESAGTLTLVAQNGVGEIAVLDAGAVLSRGSPPFDAFTAQLTGGRSGLAVGGSIVESVPYVDGRLQAISIAGDRAPWVAFVEVRTSPPGWRLRVGTLSATEVLVDSALDPLAAQPAPDATAANSRGQVAFVQVTGHDPPFDLETLFLTDGATLKRVLCRDQLEIFGFSPFIAYELAPDGLNDRGQIAFLGKWPRVAAFVVRADPVPEPAPGRLGLATLAVLGALERRRRQRPLVS